MRDSLFVLTLSCALLTGCDRYLTTLLSQAETFMDSQPDSSLVLLEGVDSTDILGRATLARWSLDRAMALDKCYRDTAAVGIIGPADRYYSRLFHPRKRFLTSYYKGRLLENAGRNREALQSLSEAESLCRDSLYRMRIFAAKGRIYAREMVPDLAKKAWQKGLETATGKDREVLALSLTDLMISTREFDRADSLLRSLEGVSPENLPWKQEVAAKLVLQHPADSLRLAGEWAAFREKARKAPETLSWKSRCQLMLLDGKAAEAQVFLAKTDTTSLPLPEKISWWQLRRLADLGTGNLEAAQEDYDRYTCIQETLSAARQRNRMGFLEDELSLKRSLSRQKRWLWGGIGFFALVLLILVQTLWKRDCKIRRQRCEAAAIREEYEALLQVRASEEARNQIFREKLEQRLVALRPYIADDFPDELYDSAELRHMLEDRKTMLRSVGLLMSLYHPRFVIELEKFGLSELEIGYCGLYALGFTGKEIPDKLRRDSFYRTSQAIRRKVGLGPHDTNLSIWVKALFNEKKAPPELFPSAHP